MVLQKYLTQLILSYARRYIRNIEANLNISLWGGDVVLNNLDLRLDGQTRRSARTPRQQDGICSVCSLLSICSVLSVLQRELGVPREFEFSRGFIKESVATRAAECVVTQ